VEFEVDFIVVINMLLPKFHRSGIFSRGSTGIPPHLDHTSWCCPPESGVWIPLVVVLQVEYSTKKLPRQSTGNTTEIPLVLRLQETISCVRAIQSRLFVRAAASTKSDNPPWWRHRNRPRRSLSKMIEKKQLCIMDHLHPIEYRYVKKWRKEEAFLLFIVCRREVLFSSDKF